MSIRLAQWPTAKVNTFVEERVFFVDISYELSSSAIRNMVIGIIIIKYLQFT